MCPLTGKFVACGLAIAQVDLDGFTEPWFGVGDNMLVDLQVSRATQRADIWSLYVCLCVDLQDLHKCFVPVEEVCNLSRKERSIAMRPASKMLICREKFGKR